jgi:hypothetical protein
VFGTPLVLFMKNASVFEMEDFRKKASTAFWLSRPSIDYTNSVVNIA